MYEKAGARLGLAFPSWWICDSTIQLRVWVTAPVPVVLPCTCKTCRVLQRSQDVFSYISHWNWNNLTSYTFIYFCPERSTIAEWKGRNSDLNNSSLIYQQMLSDLFPEITKSKNKKRPKSEGFQRVYTRIFLCTQTVCVLNIIKYYFYAYYTFIYIYYKL